jgi:hypothetical protein
VVTPAQRRALEAVEGGQVVYLVLAAHARGYSPWSAPRGVRADVLARLQAKGLIKRTRARGYVQNVALTDAGLTALSRSTRGQA